MGCAIAALAMATGMTYQEMRLEVQKYWSAFKQFRKYEGLDEHDEAIILFRLGFRALGLRPIKNHCMREYMGKTPCLMTVPSINVEGKFHALFWDGKKVHDPSPLKRYNTKMAWEAVRYVKVLQVLDGDHFLYGIRGEGNEEHQKKFRKARNA